jgi:hypothetical protein
MFRSFRATRTIVTAACVAAALAASLIGVGTVVAQSARPTLTFKNTGKLKISVKIDKIDYRNDIEPGKTDTVPATNLKTVSADQRLLWEAFQADLKSVQQTKPNPRCDGGTITLEKPATTVEIKGSC